MKNFSILILLTLFSSTAFAFSVGAIKGKIHNFSDVNNTDITVQVTIICTPNFFSKPCGSFSKEVQVKADGSFVTLPVSYSPSGAAYYTLSYSIFTKTPQGMIYFPHQTSIGSDKKLLAKELKELSLYDLQSNEILFSVDTLNFDEWLRKIEMNRFSYVVNLTDPKTKKNIFGYNLSYLTKDSATFPKTYFAIPAHDGTQNEFIIDAQVGIHGGVDPIVYTHEDTVDLAKVSEFPRSFSQAVIKFNPELYIFSGKWYVRVESSLVPYLLKLKCENGLITGEVGLVVDYPDTVNETTTARGSCAEDKNEVQFTFNNVSRTLKVTEFYPSSFNGQLLDEKGQVLSRVFGFKQDRQ